VITYRDRCYCCRKDCPVTDCDRNSCHVPWQDLPEYMGVSMSDFYGKSCLCPVEPPKLPEYWTKAGEP